MEACLPTLQHLIRHADKVIVVSHRGRPSFAKASEGRPGSRDVKQFTLAEHAKKLERLLKRKVRFVPGTHFADVALAVARAPRGSVLLLENLRFWPGEALDAEPFAHSLAALAKYYVNDAFAVSHRAAASVVGITKFLPSYVGLELGSELEHLSRIREHPKHPFVVIVGGGKAHDKLGVIRYLRMKADAFLLGGASGNTILKARGVNVRRSLVDDEAADARMLKAVAAQKNVIAPQDWRTDRGRIMDIGPKTVKRYTGLVKGAKTILWAGPLGFIEKAKYRKGNLAIARAIAANRQAFSVTGGGETVMFLKRYKLDRKFAFISTGGGALLEFLAGEELPGITALNKVPVPKQLETPRKSR